MTALHCRLLLDLLRRIEPAEEGAAPGAGIPSDIERRVSSALGRLRREGGPPPALAMAALGEIASVLEGCGARAGDGGARARVPRLVAGLAAAARDMEDAAAVVGSPDDPRRVGLRLLAESAGLAARCGGAALEAAHALLDDPWPLLRRWPAEGPDILGRLSRPEWLLDGWDAIVALWRSAGAAALRDMAPLVPAMPTEADRWCGFDASGRTEALREGLRLWRRAAPPVADTVANRIADLTARNEGLRALCA